MVENNVPAFGVGNDGNGWYHYIGNSGNIYHNQPGSDANQVVNNKIAEVRKEHGAAWRAASLNYTVNTYVIYGNIYSISNSIDGTGGVTRENGISFFRDKNGNISYVYAGGRLLTGKSIISYIVQDNVNKNASFRNISYKNRNTGSYSGTYKGLGQGASPGSKFGHIEGVVGTLDFIQWMQNNPAEVHKMQQQWYDYLNRMKNK